MEELQNPPETITREFTTDFIPVPFMSIKDKRLSPIERIILGVVYYITEKRGDKFFMSNKYVADMLGITAGTVNNSLLNLEKCGYIKRIYNQDNTKRLEIQCLLKLQLHTPNDAGGTPNDVGGTPNDAHNKIPINKINKSDWESLDEETKKWLNKESWNDWVEHRREKKNTLTERSVKMQIKLLAEHKKDHVRIIERSITNGWIGLFPEERKGYQKEVSKPIRRLSQFEKEEILDKRYQEIMRDKQLKKAPNTD